MWRLVFLQMLSAAKLQLSCNSPRSWQLSGGPSLWNQVGASGPDFIEEKKQSRENKTLALGTGWIVLKM